MIFKNILTKSKTLTFLRIPRILENILTKARLKLFKILKILENILTKSKTLPSLKILKIF